jgi:uncharacterized protein
MDRKEILKKTEEYVKSRLGGESSGHDWWHIYRVRKNAIQIGKQEGADLFVVQLAALLHDIADWKLYGGNEDIGPKLAREWLEKMQVDDKIIIHVCGIIKGLSFKGAGAKNAIKTKEGKVVQDADRLDALGAIGIARVFTFGGHKGESIYDPGVKPKKYRSVEEYKKRTPTTINHFYEKLLLLKGLMNTKAAKRIAEKRHRFMEQFLKQFYEEWEGKA